MAAMTPEALANDERMGQQGMPLIGVEKIYIDNEFNCRGSFSPMDCVELANDIAMRGLQQPVTVRPLRVDGRPGMPSEQVLIDKGFTHKAIAGHRRITAYKINKTEKIPAILKDAYIDEFEAKDLNAIENLQRRELTLWQEARAIQHYWIADWTREDIAQRVQKSPGWVQIRIQLLELDHEIQEYANSGLIKQNDVRQLHGIHDRTERLKTAAVIRDQRRSGKKSVSVNLNKAKPKASSTKHRLKGEILAFLSHVQQTMTNAEAGIELTAGELVTPQGNSFATRCLAWCAGEISNRDIYMELKKFAELTGYEYQLPTFQED